MVLDISSKLGKEKQEIKIAEGMIFEVDCSAETMLKAEEMFKNMGSPDEMFEVLGMFLGKTSVNKIRKDLKPTIKELKTIIIGVMAQVNEEDFESCMSRFQASI